jgi:MFS family permease
MKIHLRNALISALGFGLGFVIGYFFGILVFGLLPALPDLFETGRLILSVALVILVVGLIGAIGGAIGGLALSYASPSANRPRYVWSGALSFGFSYAAILFPLIFTFSLVALDNLAEASPMGLMIPLGIVGAIFGAVSGIILGLLTVGRQAWRVVLVSTLGFAAGGWELGYFAWTFFFGREGLREVNWVPLVGLFLFGVIGGGALGFLYSWLARRKPKPGLVSRLVAWFKRSKLVPRLIAAVVLILVFLALRGLWLISPFNSNAAPLTNILESQTIGTHWSSPVSLIEDVEVSDSHPALFADESGSAAIGWDQAMASGTDVYYATQTGDEGRWSAPINVSNSETGVSTNPQLVTDSEGNLHIVWTEAAEAGSDTSKILYSQCTGSTCTPPVRLSILAGLGCLTTPSVTQNDGPSIAIDEADTLLVTWRNGQRTLPYSIWAATASPPETPTGCVPIGDQNGETIGQLPRLSGGAKGSFSLAFDRLDSDQNGEIYVTQFTNGSWDAAPTLLGQGQAPEIFTDLNNQIHVAWCNQDNQLDYWTSTGQTGAVPFPHCSGRPGLAQGNNGLVRLVWYSTEVENVEGAVNPNELIYESAKTDDGWTEPTIISQTNGPTQPTVATGGDGALHLAWKDSPDDLYYATQTEYDCTGVELTDIGQTIFDVIRQEKFRPASDPIPFCHNQYDGLIYAPNPDPAFSDETPTPNGAFDHFVEVAKTAEYEVDFVTMWYEPDVNQDSPGSLLAGAIADLYQDLKEDPARYPRGLTVRIVLGNPPAFALFPTLNGQMRLLLEDLRAAGVPEMSNPELGWNLEVANFSGAWPHSHHKMMVVDGRTVIGAGYNLQYAHYAKDHPSGRGKDKMDLGLQLTGPVAQPALQAFDDIWEASTRVYCADIDPSSRFLWMFSCHTETATAEHVPEVLRHYVSDVDGNAFSLHRTQNFREADEAFYQALVSAQLSIDTIQVNFTLGFVCDLGIIGREVCNFSNRIEPLAALMAAIETNRTEVRILLKESPIDGYENKIAITAFLDEAATRGLSELVEIRFFNGDQVHPKVALIDEELLVVGSQNFHYSAWGDQALTEYNLATDDPQAVEDFKKMFEYHWERAIPVE